MVSFLSSFAALFTAVLSATSVTAAPVESGLVARDAAPAAPHFVIYSDKWISGETGPPAPSDLTGYNVFALSFWLSTGPADQAATWAQLDNATRASTKSAYEAAGIKLLVSAFGSTETPTSSGEDPVKTADSLAAWVIANNLDGVDVDYEDLAAFKAMDGSAEKWLESFTTELRAKLPATDYIITHAPVAPWFSPSFTGGGYVAVDKAVGNLIDWYNIQFYNQGTSEYTTCDGLLTQSSAAWPKSSLFEISAQGVPLDKLVIGKPATATDATNGFIDTATLAGCLQTAAGQKWNAGVMVWEYPDAAADWIKAVRALAFPE
ncbi:glycoside hydrolase family 18 protein [Coniophora puteana RWD-64-598 SS2]|uniref:chitinase n=1 Tax=Coniophora puteana (strain RWD-64-598) TaxID=741705 RepID=A0A5M3MKM6_CONPW|nr:glycoside hydrolase family 18 protein [Coniophora puteana RWD-64-598 SS2]EIW79374.1 glycoside hydrolase family 18 protein [Coniophora puteana RWD-64-598 SS2]